MRRGPRFVVALAALCVAALLVSCGSSASPAAPGTATASGALIVNGAGTLAAPFEQVIAAFKERNPGVTVQSRFAGSVELIRGITELNTPVDVLGVADYSLIPAKMFGAAGGRRFATWYVGFASNRITFAYTDRSKGAAGLTPDNWYRVLAQPGVRIGRSNPDTDPSGYQVLQMLALAQAYYRAPDLAAGVLANSPPATLVGTETQLLPALQSGQIDYLGIYRSDALQHRLRFIDLPPQVDLSDPAQAATYGTVSTPTSSGAQTGKPIVYALTVPSDAPNAALGERFVAFVLSPAGQQIMRDNGFTVLSPPVAGGRVPPSLQPMTTPAALPGG
ncbi:extracellular solute-binding protein [Pseudonocardia acidicola]|uniref:Extracellular solute-binding protein n=1 Tax=Pseudonocardia acidicola TaxID=2724939 RepID=A0ABX1S6W4_9PSEU|nr:extracellular solute-binding protein [Pseudonocardia acidicola]NMH97298.1 extracellular solute-binding protein [Pseudonocardia acidicola]